MTSVNGANRPLIFISYSHRDAEAKGFVDDHLGVLHNLGTAEVWEDGQLTIGDAWFEVIKEKLKACSVAVLLVSNHFLKSEFCIKEEVKILLEEEKRRRGMLIAPILLRPCAWQLIPWLAAIQMWPRDSQPLLALDSLQQDETLTDVVLAFDEFLKKQAALVDEAKDEAQATGERTTIQGDNNTLVQVDGDNVNINIVAGPKTDTAYPMPHAIDLTRLPASGFDVVGRDKDLQFLNEAFDGNKLNVVALRAWGGVGKSTLVNKWVEYLAADNYRGAERVFAWSFYSQGTNERVTSADAFIDEALRFFNDTDPTAGSAWSRGERLAELVGREKALLILDGMEPLQDAHQGIKDAALSRLVECLAIRNAGLCVITTREPVKEFSDFPETTVEKDLEHLSKEAGRALLRIKGLRVADDLLERVSEAFGNHALALNLLARYLTLAKRPVADALEIPDLPEVTVDDGKHPRRVMAAFAETFGEGPELDLLHVMGLFDRPADAKCIAALRKEPAVPGLTEYLVQGESGVLAKWWERATGRTESRSGDALWDQLLIFLRDLGLLAPASHHDPEELDAHPLVREHFGARLRAERDDAWKAGHLRLFEHLQTVPEMDQPDTLIEMAPLFQAVLHGCAAGQHQEAYDKIYGARIRRQDEFYLVKKLGAFGADLGVIASFFDSPWEQPAASIVEDEQAWLLNMAAADLRALGRLRDAVAPMRVGLERGVEQEDWAECARRAGNLSELHLTLGDVADAVSMGEACIKHADRSGDDFQRMINRTTLADALMHRGDLQAAKALFEEAEAMQAKSQPTYPKLYSLQGYRYCDLLLTLGQAKEVRERGAYALDIVLRGSRSLLDIALNHLSLGRAALALGEHDEARSQLDLAVEGLRKAGQLDDLPRGLLARAALFRETEEYETSKKDLDEAMRIAERGEMRLHQCDAHLDYARLALAEGRPDAARAPLANAKRLVQKTGYHRRDPDLQELSEKLSPSP